MRMLLKEAFNLEYRFQLSYQVISKVDLDLKQMQQLLLLLIANLLELCFDLTD